MKRLSIFAIRVYQFFRPLLRVVILSAFGFESECHQTPTCSEYTISQIRKHGTITGLKRGVARVSKCMRLASPITR